MNEINHHYVWTVIGAMALATFITRAAPFVLLSGLKDNRHLRFLGQRFPPAVMLLLVFYCLKDTPIQAAPHGLPELLGVGTVVAVHLWRRNSLISIALGTSVYLAAMRLFNF